MFGLCVTATDTASVSIADCWESCNMGVSPLLYRTSHYVIFILSLPISIQNEREVRKSFLAAGFVAKTALRIRVIDYWLI
jgi:hypothetical protein